MSRVLVLTALLVAFVAPQARAGTDPHYSGAEFQELYDYAIGNTLPDLETPSDRYVVTGDEDLDERLWQAAFERGYVLRPEARGQLASVAGVPMQPQAAEAWTGLRAVARDAGMGFIVSSAYRSPSAQRTHFLSKLGGTSDAAIDATLRWYSLPGTSKHHAGYALDFRYASGTFGEFRSTKDYDWLASDNFAIPKAFGLIPSYPDDVENQGPNPEPWEFVWVGEDLIQCGVPRVLATEIAGPAVAIVHALSRCPGGPAPAALPAWLA